MVYYFVNVKPREEVKVGVRVRVDIPRYKNFVGTITDIKDGVAYIHVPVHYSTQPNQFIEVTQPANNLYKYL